MTTDKDRDRDRDIAIGKLLEAVSNLEKQVSQQQVKADTTTEIIFTKLSTLQTSLDRFQGAKGLAILLLTILGSLGLALLEAIKLWLGHHKH